MPLLQDLEISSGALLGLGRVAMGIEQTVLIQDGNKFSQMLMEL